MTNYSNGARLYLRDALIGGECDVHWRCVDGRLVSLMIYSHVSGTWHHAIGENDEEGVDYSVEEFIKELQAARVEMLH